MNEIFGLHKLREEVHNRVLKLRRIQTIVESLRFEQFWETLSPIEKASTDLKAKIGAHEELLTAMRAFESAELGEKRIRALRELAKKAGIKDYSRKKREELIRELEEYNGKE